MYKHEIMMKLQMWNAMYRLFEFNNRDPKYIWRFSEDDKKAVNDLSKSLGWGSGGSGIWCISSLVDGPKD